MSLKHILQTLNVKLGKKDHNLLALNQKFLDIQDCITSYPRAFAYFSLIKKDLGSLNKYHQIFKYSEDIDGNPSFISKSNFPLDSIKIIHGYNKLNLSISDAFLDIFPEFS